MAVNEMRTEPPPLSGPVPPAKARLDRILSREKWHEAGSGWMSGAIYGANDGLAAVFGIVTGVSGATGGSSFVLAAGVAGAVASALSMATGACLAERSEMEVAEANTAIVVAGVVSLIAHFAVGAAKSLFTLRGWWASGLEMTLAGVIVGGATYAIGLAFA
jgi:VIT1/CCC1 family predicted Fe2+/Mn2+ transporter